MKLLLKRVALKDAYTIGKLYVDGMYFCDTLEDTVRDLNHDGDLDDQGETKVYGQTAIPYGTYEIKMQRSPHFKRILPRLQNVKNFEAILIHAGNTIADTFGCILVGENKEKGKVLNSRYHENKLVQLLQQAEGNKEKLTIKIE